MDGRTDGPTDGPTKRGVESRSTRLKSLQPQSRLQIKGTLVRLRSTNEHPNMSKLVLNHHHDIDVFICNWIISLRFFVRLSCFPDGVSVTVR